MTRLLTTALVALALALPSSALAWGIFNEEGGDPPCNATLYPCTMATVNGVEVHSVTTTSAVARWLPAPQREVPLLGYFVTLARGTFPHAVPFYRYDAGTSSPFEQSITGLSPGTAYEVSVCPDLLYPERNEASCASAGFTTRSATLVRRAGAVRR